MKETHCPLPPGSSLPLPLLLSLLLVTAELLPLSASEGAPGGAVLSLRPSRPLSLPLSLLLSLPASLPVSLPVTLPL
jgi:hypothetical protein